MTRSVLTHPEVSSVASPGSICCLVCNFYYPQSSVKSRSFNMYFPVSSVVLYLSKPGVIFNFFVSSVFCFLTCPSVSYFFLIYFISVAVIRLRLLSY